MSDLRTTAAVARELGWKCLRAGFWQRKGWDIIKVENDWQVWRWPATMDGVYPTLKAAMLAAEDER